jgi:hypothetical protein
MKRILCALSLVILLAACGGGSKSVDLKPTINGKPISEFNAQIRKQQKCQKVWDDAVDKWNVLVGVDGVRTGDAANYPDFKSWARAHDFPVSYESLHCGEAR